MAEGPCPSGRRKREATRRNRRAHQSPRRSRSVLAYLSDEEHAVLETAAEREHLALGAYVAQAALAQATLAQASGVSRADQSLLRELLRELMQARSQVRRLGVNLNQSVAALHSGELTEQLGAYARACAQTVNKLDRTADEVCRRLP